MLLQRGRGFGNLLRVKDDVAAPEDTQVIEEQACVAPAATNCLRHAAKRRPWERVGKGRWEKGRGEGQSRCDQWLKTTEYEKEARPSRSRIQNLANQANLSWLKPSGK